MVPALRELGADVQCIFSGRDPEKYFDMDVFGDNSVLVPGAGFSHKDGSLDKLGTYFNWAVQLPKIALNATQLDVSEFDLVISDMEPVSALAARLKGIPCIELSRHVSRNLGLEVEEQVGWIDRTAMNMLVPSDHQLGVHWHSFGQDNLIPPLLSVSREDIPEADLHQVLVYLNFESLEDIEGALSPHAQGTRFIVYSPKVSEVAERAGITFKPLSREGFIGDMKLSSGLIANAGFNASSEALQLGKDVLVKPLGGQAEQVSNMQAIEYLNLGAGMRELDSDAIGTWLEKRGTFSKVQFPDDTAKRVAAWVLEGDWHKPEDLSESLWADTNFEAS